MIENVLAQSQNTSSSPMEAKDSSHRSEPKLAELKKEAYGLAKVDNTKALKALSSNFVKLDFRRKDHWKKAITILKKEPSYEEWCAEPPEKYRELFAEIDQVSKDSEKIIEQGDQFIKGLEKDTNSLERIANECQEEADSLREEAMAAIRQERKSRLN